MSSTDLDAPPLRLILIAIFIVVGLHALTAIALVTIKAPEPKDEPIKETPPLEIQMVTLPAKLAESVVAEVEETPQSKSQPIPESKTGPKPKPKPKFERKSEPKPPQKMKVLTPADPVVTEKEPAVQKETPPEKLAIKEQPVKKKIEDKQPKQKQIDPNKAAADEQRRMIAAQAEKAAQQAESQAQAKALQEAHAAREAQAQADAKAARAKAEREAESAARAEADGNARAAAAASNEPINFTASAANWTSAPNFSFPDRAARRARSGDTLNVVLVLRVNKQGGIDSVRIAQSSGNTLLDKEAQRQVRSGKFKPFTKNGVPVVGNVTLPIAYTVP